mgnify:CR=1 FL=1
MALLVEGVALGAEVGERRRVDRAQVGEPRQELCDLALRPPLAREAEHLERFELGEGGERALGGREVVAAAEVEAANDVPRGGRLRTIVFSDGSSREVV